jgi:hypothetical protein
MCNPENIRGSGDKLVSELSIICHLLEAQKSGPGQGRSSSFPAIAASQRRRGFYRFLTRPRQSA